MRISPAKKGPEKIKMKVSPDGVGGQALLAEWWKAEDERQLAEQLHTTAAYLKQNQTYRIRQLAVDVRMYSGLSVYSYAGANYNKMDRSKTLPDARPTFNLIESSVDTLVSRVSQNEPQPKFLTDGADYRHRHLAQKLNQFILGEFYQVKAYEKAKKMFRDACVMGTGALKVYEGDDDRVVVDRVMTTDLYVDDNDSLNGEPQQMVQLKLVDREKLMANHPKFRDVIEKTPQSYPDNAPDTGRTTANQVLVVEGWKLPPIADKENPEYVPGRHTIATIAGVIFDEPWEKAKFPFVFLKYADPFLGYWGRGIATRLFGTQVSLNGILDTIYKSIKLLGVPRIFQSTASKVVKAHHNDQIGVIIEHEPGQKPSYEVAPCNAPELYNERDKLIEYGYRQEGISDMQATGKKPGGLNSGEAIRSYDDINSDRFTETQKKYEQLFVDLAYLVTDTAMDICRRTGKYQTIYPNKDGTKEIDLPAMKFLEDPFIIQCFTESSLPRTPAGRIATVTEQIQAGMLTVKEGRRLLKFPDLEENEKLDNASEERIFKYLDMIVEDADYNPPDPFMDFDLANTLVVQYINLYRAANLEQKKDDMLVTFFKQIQTLKQAGMPPPMPQPVPQAVAAPAPVSPMLPNAPGAAAA